MLVRSLLAASLLGVLGAPLGAQSPADQRLAWRDQLLAADRAMADTSSVSGLAAAIARSAHADLALLYPGAPVVAGRDLAMQLLAAQDALRSLRVRWTPLYAEVSEDGTLGVTWGATALAATGATGAPLRMGKYLSAWRRGADGWRLVAHAQLGLLPAAAYTTTPGLRGATTVLPSSGAVADFARADTEFATLAGREGAGIAFATWAAADAVVFPGTGELVRGPDAIRRLMTETTPSQWRWAPVLGGASGSGDLGFTVGEATIIPQGGAPAYTKYLSLWRRENDGRIRYLADGGNGRPGP